MAFLKITTGDAVGQVHQLANDTFTMGRAAGNDIVLNDQAASGKHCAVVREGRKFTLRDLGSTNGTMLNGVMIREAPLRPKDVLTVGSVEIIFDGDDVDGAEPAPPPGVRTGETVRLSNRPALTTPFEAKRSNKWAWRAVLSLAGVFVLIALGFFLYKWLSK